MAKALSPFCVSHAETVLSDVLRHSQFCWSGRDNAGTKIEHEGLRVSVGDTMSGIEILKPDAKQRMCQGTFRRRCKALCDNKSKIALSDDSIQMSLLSIQNGLYGGKSSNLADYVYPQGTQWTM